MDASSLVETYSWFGVMVDLQGAKPVRDDRTELLTTLPQNASGRYLDGYPNALDEQ